MTENQQFSFSLVEHDEHTTKVLFCSENIELIRNVLESYEFDLTEHSSVCFYINEGIEDVFEELDSYEIDDSSSVLLKENEDGFYISPLDDVYEILAISTVNVEDEDLLLEGPAKRKLVIRKGKRKVIFKCGPGQMKVGKSCRKRPTNQLNRMKRRAKIIARKSRQKRRSTVRKRKISMRKRAVLVHTTKKKKVFGPSKPKRFKSKH